MITEAFAHPVTRWICGGCVLLLAAAPVLFEILNRMGKTPAKLRAELYTRYWSWLIMVPLIAGPILLGRLPTIIAVGLLSLLCYREFARATGLFRHPSVSTVVALGILLLTFAAADHWYGLYVSLISEVIAVLVVVAVLADTPKGFIQRVALAIMAYLFFGVCFGHLGFLANDARYRPILLLMFLSVELNDIFAFCWGKWLGRRKLIPHTSPNKTWAGALGALACTTLLFALIGKAVFAGTAVDHPVHLVVMGLLLSASGQFGDLVLSSIKRDLDIKDMAHTLPGHGGLLDRFDSMLLVAPLLFHYLAFFMKIGVDQPVRVFSGGG